MTNAATGINRYKADLRDMRFLLFEQFQLDDLLGKPPFEGWARDDVEMVLGEVYKWCCDVSGPLNRVGDQIGCRFDNGKVITPPGFREAWKSLCAAGWRSLSVDQEYGGQGGPFALSVLAGEMLSGSNTAFNMYSGLSEGVAEVLESFGTPEQITRYVRKLHDGTFAGTMCLTEAHAGSDVGASSTKATPAPELGAGKYKISGTKVFISGGQHDLADNIIHLVLARIADAPAGTRGLSLFIVPRDRLDGTGGNDVTCASIEHKMGINGSATAVLVFGDAGECVGELVGSEEQQGMRQMFKMMNLARIGVGIQGLAIAGSAYLNALSYARERKQGPSVKAWKDAAAPKVPIIEHPNIRRLLLDMKSRVEGIRALIVKLAVHIDRERALRPSDPEAAEYHQGQVDLLVPIVKSYASDQGFNIAATAIQVFGGAGYIQDHPVEQYCRDAKIFSIYEGTNHIQALDLVGRKLGQRGGANFQAFIRDVKAFVAAHKGHPTLGEAISMLDAAADAVMGTAMRFLGWFNGGKIELAPLNANRFLEIMAVTTVGWMLLSGAVVAEKAAAGLPADSRDAQYYQGKRFAATYYANLELPRVPHHAANMGKEERSPLDIPDAGFGEIA